jgi:hypothetical protein
MTQRLNQMDEALGIIEIDGGKYTLTEDRIWQGEDDAIVAELNERFNLENYSPSQGQPGATQTNEAAEYFGGKVAYLPETVYDAKSIY